MNPIDQLEQDKLLVAVQISPDMSCLRCGHSWKARPAALAGQFPRQCPRCRSWKWQTPRRDSKPGVGAVHQQAGLREGLEQLRKDLE